MQFDLKKGNDPLHDKTQILMMGETRWTIDITSKDLFPDRKHVLVVDAETTVTDGNPDATVPSNKLVAFGCINQSVTDMRYHPIDADFGSSTLLDYPVLLVGHHVKFDLKWMLREFPSFSSFIHKIGCWDTQIAHYILSGQKDKFPSLAEAAARYEYTGKGDLIPDWLGRGFNVDQIPKDELLTYLAHDLVLTAYTAKAQMAEAEKMGLTKLILCRSQATLAIACIEMNGIAFDPVKLVNTANNARMDQVTAMRKYVYELEQNQTGPSVWSASEIAAADNFKMSSRSLTQAAIYGGPFEFELREQVPKKNGIGTKTSIKRFISTFQPCPSVVDMPDELRNSTKDGMAINDDVMEWLTLRGETIPSLIQAYRRSEKIVGTYVQGLFRNARDPVTGYARTPPGSHLSLVHGTIHECSTHTGRTSSADPNLQNFPEQDTYGLRSTIVSRFGEEGVLIEADYDQLEVVALASQLEPGAPLAEAIRSGVDVHYATASELWMTPTKDQRRLCKTVNFGLIYGGSAPTIAAQTGATVPEVKRCIKAFFDLYPDVRDYQSWLKFHVDYELQRCPIIGNSEKGYPIRGGVVDLGLPSRRVFYYEEEDNPYKKGEVSVKPTVVKNYPIQGWATGDIVPLGLGILWRRIQADEMLRGKALIINTIHDSFLLDVHLSVKNRVVELVRDTINRTPEYIEKFFGEKFELPVNCKIKVGPDWGHLVEV